MVQLHLSHLHLAPIAPFAPSRARSVLFMRLVMSSIVMMAMVAALNVGAVAQGGGAPAAGAPQGGAPRGGGGGRGGGRGFNLPPLLMETDAFPDGGIIPAKYAGRGGNVQPAFKFSGAPANTVSYAIIFHDVDVALGGGTADVLHWAVWNIPASANGIPEARYRTAPSRAD